MRIIVEAGPAGISAATRQRNDLCANVAYFSDRAWHGPGRVDCATLASDPDSHRKGTA